MPAARTIEPPLPVLLSPTVCVIPPAALKLSPVDNLALPEEPASATPDLIIMFPLELPKPSETPVSMLKEPLSPRSLFPDRIVTLPPVPVTLSPAVITTSDPELTAAPAVIDIAPA